MMSALCLIEERSATMAPNQNPSGLGVFNYSSRLPGQYADAESGLNYNMRRDYNPGLGRYVESDPKGLAAGINTYAYVGNNPLTRIDPRGLDWNVTEYQGGPGNPFGHVGIGGVIPNMSTPTIGFYGAPTSSPIELFEGSPSVWMTDMSTPITTVTIQTSPWQDFLIENYIQNAINNPQEYNHGNTCSSVVGKVLNAGDVNAPSTIFPGLLIPGLRQMQQFTPIPASSPAFTPVPQY